VQLNFLLMRRSCSLDASKPPRYFGFEDLPLYPQYGELTLRKVRSKWIISGGAIFVTSLPIALIE
jgi:hypothetical protein